MLFIGQADLTIDAKQRLAIPAKFRARYAVEDGVKPVWVSVPWPEGRLLRLYPEPAFLRLAESLGDSLTPDEDVAERDAVLFSQAEPIEADSVGRVRLPKRHLDMVEMPSEVVALGVRSRLEIRSQADWKAGEMDRFRSLPSLVRRIDAKNR